MKGLQATPGKCGGNVVESVNRLFKNHSPSHIPYLTCRDCKRLNLWLSLQLGVTTWQNHKEASIYIIQWSLTGHLFPNKNTSPGGKKVPGSGSRGAVPAYSNLRLWGFHTDWHQCVLAEHQLRFTPAHTSHIQTTELPHHSTEQTRPFHPKHISVSNSTEKGESWHNGIIRTHMTTDI